MLIKKSHQLTGALGYGFGLNLLNDIVIICFELNGLRFSLKALKGGISCLLFCFLHLLTLMKRHFNNTFLTLIVFTLLLSNTFRVYSFTSNILAVFVTE